MVRRVSIVENIRQFLKIFNYLSLAVFFILVAFCIFAWNLLPKDQFFIVLALTLMVLLGLSLVNLAASTQNTPRLVVFNLLALLALIAIWVSMWMFIPHEQMVWAAIFIVPALSLVVTIDVAGILIPMVNHK